jgi:hypothetical protein
MNSYTKAFKDAVQASPYMVPANAPAGFPICSGGGMPMSTAGLPTGIPAGQPMNPFPPVPQSSVNASQMTGMPFGQQNHMNPAIQNGCVPSQSGAAQQGGQPLTTVDSVLFTPGFLRTQIGRVMRVEFLIGNNMLVDRMGTLVAVGASYIILREIEQDDLLLCDIYSIKFVRIYY